MHDGVRNFLQRGGEDILEEFCPGYFPFLERQEGSRDSSRADLHENLATPP